MRLPSETPVRQIAGLVACAAALQSAESLVPYPLPGMRLGLANLVTLIALERLGAAAALEIAGLRCLVSAWAMGTFLSPAFLFSLASALASTACMAAAAAVLRRGARPVVSLVGLSMLGAAAHNVTQVVVAYAIVVRHPGVFMLLPALGLAAVATGWFNGVVATAVCRRLDARPAAVADRPSAPPCRSDFLPSLPTDRNARDHGRSGRRSAGWLYRCRPLPKVAAAVAVMTAGLVVRDSRALAVLLLGALALALLAGMEARAWLSRLRRLLPFLLVSLAVPALLVREGAEAARWGAFGVTEGGLALGLTFGLRLTLLMTCAAAVAATTAPADLMAAFDRLLAPPRRRGARPARLTAILAGAWCALPGFRDRYRAAWARRAGAARPRRLVACLADALAEVYAEAEGRASP